MGKPPGKNELCIGESVVLNINICSPCNRNSKAAFRVKKLSVYRQKTPDSCLSLFGEFNLLKSNVRQTFVKLHRMTLDDEELKEVVAFYINSTYFSVLCSR